MICDAKARSAEQVEQRKVLGAVLDSRVLAARFVNGVLLGGELAGVVTADDTGESAEDEDEDEDEAEWRREKGSLKLGSR